MDMVNVMDMAPSTADPNTGASHPTGSDPWPANTAWTTNPAGSTTRTRKGVGR